MKILLSQKRKKRGQVSPNPVKVMHHPMCTTLCSAFYMPWNALPQPDPAGSLSLSTYKHIHGVQYLWDRGRCMLSHHNGLWILAATMLCGCGPAMLATCKQIDTNSTYPPFSGKAVAPASTTLIPYYSPLNELVIKLGTNNSSAIDRAVARNTDFAGAHRHFDDPSWGKYLVLSSSPCTISNHFFGFSGISICSILLQDLRRW